ncbi:MAG TPA: ABC transporter substrate-binding protein [Ilumatobacteraceae bacterium]|jgi:peptide/nickel transport system substrate-binding protein
MDHRLIDSVRRQASPHEVDLVDSFTEGRISRRSFVNRGMMMGIGAPLIAAVLAACGSDTKTSSAPAGSTASAGTTASAGSTASAGTTASSGSTAPAKIKQGGTLRIAAQTPAAPLDPVAMADLGTYTPVTTAFEYLVDILGADVKPMLAEKWSPNADGSVWTFNLRKGVKWHDGTPFTAADVVATMDRLSASNLKSYIDAGSTKAVDDFTVEITLKHPDGQFPQQVGAYNPQSVITPKDFVIGTTLDQRKTGTGAFKLTSYDPATGATFDANPDWWGGKPFLDKLQYIYSDDMATQMSGLQGGAADAIVQFTVVGGEALLSDDKVTVEVIHGSGHRQMWMNCREGDFTDKRVRQAVALGIDRQALIDNVLKGKGDIGNDHPISPIYPFFDASVPQRQRDVAKAKQLLSDAGKAGLSATLYFPKLQEIPQLAQLIQSQLKDIGMNVTLQQESVVDGEEWCKVYDSKNEPAGCDGGKDFGIVDYGPRGVPDVYLVKAYATGEWNSAHYISEPMRAAVKEYQSSLQLDGQKAAITKIETIANEDVPYVIPYFYNTLVAYSKNVTGIVSTGLGHFYCGKAGFTA